MKKIVALLMASAMAASLAACGGNAQSSEAAIAEAIKSAQFSDAKVGRCAEKTVNNNIAKMMSNIIIDK
jgi:ABC-type glycerol-3-phosphate transport system substrate-binding protein